jgi:hypothetical protein
MGPHSGSGPDEGVKIIFLAGSGVLVVLGLVGLVIIDIAVVIAALLGLLLTVGGWGYEDRFRDMRVSIDWDSVKW